MVYNNIKIALRNLYKQKIYASIKIGGFALGIAACIFIALFIQNELSYDQHYNNTDRIYRVVMEYNEGNGIQKGVHWAAPFAKALMDEFPEIEEAGRINAVELFGAGSNQVRRTDSKVNFYEKGLAYADHEMMNILDVSLVYGESDKILTEANTVVVSKSFADKHFPNKNPVGKSIIINDKTDLSYQVCGVFNDFPKTSHLQYQIYVALHPNIFYPGEQTRWTASNYYTYIEVKPGVNIAQLENKLKLINEKYFAPTFEMDIQTINEMVSYSLQPIGDIHLHSADIDDDLHHGDIRFVWMFGIIAAFILLIAAINFINLTTAKSSARAKEVGVRKSLGAQKLSIMQQFLTEAVLYSFISVCLALLLVVIAMPLFNHLAAKSLGIPFTSWWFIPLILSSGLLIAFLSGTYPAFYLSSFKPINALKGKLNPKKSNLTGRNGLVVFQFAASIVLIISTMIVFNQVDFMLNKKLGFKKEQVVILHGTSTLADNISTFKSELLKKSGIENVSISNFLPIEGSMRNGNSISKAGEWDIESSVFCQKWDVDYDYLETLGINLVEGRIFSKNFSTDNSSVIVNQNLVNDLHFESPIGKRITNGGDIWEIIGVVEDFHFETMKEDIGPLCMKLGKSTESMLIKISTDNTSAVLANIETVWNEFSPNQALRYSFMDSDFELMYSDVKQMGNIFMCFAVLAIIVACLGLFGLAEFITKARIKEIGVRKVNGAKVSELMQMLNADFIKWVAISFFVATPIAYYGMTKWLENFAYKTEMNWWVFALAGVLSLCIAILTVSWQTFRAARRNPVEALRYE
ncbi:MAG: ABC transporter permease [Salinivirgaceae bacterium]|jgi:putative ABC transport system permease protein|nr:ABC transporter permease [Salinivirgaceae bacterium]